MKIKHTTLSFLILLLSFAFSNHSGAQVSKSTVTQNNSSFTTTVHYMVDEAPLGVYADCNLLLEALNADGNVVSSLWVWSNANTSFPVPSDAVAVRASVSSIQPWPSADYQLYLGVKATYPDGTIYDLNNQLIADQTANLTYTAHFWERKLPYSDIEIHAMTLHK